MIRKWIVVLFILLGVSASNAIETAERISDREIIERLTKVETKLDEGQKAMNQRFDDVNKRFDDVGKRFDDVNRQFDDVSNSINHMKDFMTWGFGVIFVSMSSLAGFVLWDRRSALAPAVRKNKELEEREEVLERWKKMVDMALKELAGGDVKVANVLRHVGLL